MAKLNKEENEIIDAQFKQSSVDELLNIKKLIVDVKKRKGLHHDVIKHGSNLFSSKNYIIEKTGLSDKTSGSLATILWFIAKPELEIAKRLKIGVSEATWIYDEFVCKHPDHHRLDGKKYSLHKGMRIGFFKRIHPGQLVGCGCVSKPILPF